MRDEGVLGIPSIKNLKEPLSGLTHFIGAVMATVGLVFLIREATYPFKPWHLTAFAIYGASMILLYSASTLFHWLPQEDNETSRLRKLDHIMIFIFIGGTYTPICLVPLREVCGWGILACVWGMAAIGGVSKIYYIKTPPWITALVYVLVASFGLVRIGPITDTLQEPAVFWLMAGGIAYCIGALVYAIERPDPLPDFFGFHEIFHIFVMIGSAAHFWVVFRYVSAFD